MEDTPTRCASIGAHSEDPDWITRCALEAGHPGRHQLTAAAAEDLERDRPADPTCTSTATSPLRPDTTRRCERPTGHDGPHEANPHQGGVLVWRDIAQDGYQVLRCGADEPATTRTTRPANAHLPNGVLVWVRDWVRSCWPRQESPELVDPPENVGPLPGPDGYVHFPGEGYVSNPKPPGLGLPKSPPKAAPLLVSHVEGGYPSAVLAGSRTAHTRNWQVPCPACGLFQAQPWSPVDVKTSDHHCTGCGVRFLEHQKLPMTAAGEWRWGPRHGPVEPLPTCQTGPMLAEAQETRRGSRPALDQWLCKCGTWNLIHVRTCDGCAAVLPGPGWKSAPTPHLALDPADLEGQPTPVVLERASAQGVTEPARCTRVPSCYAEPGHPGECNPDQDASANAHPPDACQDCGAAEMQLHRIDCPRMQAGAGLVQLADGEAAPVIQAKFECTAETRKPETFSEPPRGLSQAELLEDQAERGTGVYTRMVLDGAGLPVPTELDGPVRVALKAAGQLGATTSGVLHQLRVLLCTIRAKCRGDEPLPAGVAYAYQTVRLELLQNVQRIRLDAPGLPPPMDAHGPPDREPAADLERATDEMATLADQLVTDIEQLQRDLATDLDAMHVAVLEGGDCQDFRTAWGRMQARLLEGADVADLARGQRHVRVAVRGGKTAALEASARRAGVLECAQQPGQGLRSSGTPGLDELAHDPTLSAAAAQRLDLLRTVSNGEVWLWAGNESDQLALADLSCPVVISADHLRALLRVKP